MLADETFRAVADPTRRAILDLLAGTELGVTEIGARFDMTQPAISQHLKVLREAGLVTADRDGKRQIYRLLPEGLRPIQRWMAQFEKFWNDRLDRLGALLDRQEFDGAHPPQGDPTCPPPPPAPTSPPAAPAARPSSRPRLPSTGSTRTRRRRSGAH